MLQSLTAGWRQRAWMVTWHPAVGGYHAKPGTGAMQRRQACPGLACVTLAFLYLQMLIVCSNVERLEHVCL